MGFLLGLDIGTTTIKAILYDPQLGQIISSTSKPTPVDHPAEGLSQHDPEQLWKAVAECLHETSNARTVDGLAISSFAEAGLPLDDHYKPLYPIIAWYDQRTIPQADWWKTKLSIDELYFITGQRLSPSFGVNKWLWLRQNAPLEVAHMALWLSAVDYINWRLTGETITDYTQASRTLLFDQRQKKWSASILDLSGLDIKKLPRLQTSGTLFGKVTLQAAKETGLPAGTPCILGGHDHLCAALAAGAYQPGVVIDSMGSSESTLVTLDYFIANRSVVEHGYTCYAHVIKDLYILKAGLHAAGSAIEWLVRILSNIQTNNIALPYAELEDEAESGVGKRIGPLWLPHFIGSGTPEMDWNSQAAMIAVRPEHNRGDLLRGLLESLAFWFHQNLAEIEFLSGQHASRVVLLGGTTRLQLLSKLKAATLNLPVVIPDLPESAATGAALLAGLGTGIFKNPKDAISSLKINSKTIEPDPALVKWYVPIYEKLYLGLYPSLKDISQEIKNLENLYIRTF